MRFVAVKSPEQQSLMMLHRVRLMLNRQRTQISNAIRAHISEFGVVAPVGRLGVERLLEVVADASDDRVLEDARLLATHVGRLRAGLLLLYNRDDLLVRKPAPLHLSVSCRGGLYLTAVTFQGSASEENEILDRMVDLRPEHWGRHELLQQYAR